MSSPRPSLEEAYTKLSRLLSDESMSAQQRSIVGSLLSTIDHLALAGSDLLDLKIADTALQEMSDAFDMFRPYRHVKKLTMFGSARTKAHDPIYELAVRLAERLADHDWMVITGAGPGIMEAGIEGAGADRSFGVNILLPFEQGANALIALDPKLVEMRYFFTRKLMMVKESDAYAVLPGGFGTLDEVFELLTLLQTGKAQPAPLVLVDTPASGYWEAWNTFLSDHAVASGYISAEDEALYRIVQSTDDAIEEITRFYANYDSLRMVGANMIVRCHVTPTPEQVEQLNDEFADILLAGRIETTGPTSAEQATQDRLELPRLTMQFDRMHYGRLRTMIDRLNSFVL